MTGGYKILILLFLCFWLKQSRAQEHDFSISWNGDQATSLLINNKKIPELNLRLSGKEQQIAGSVSVDQNTRFKPYFPFNIGSDYQVFDGKQLLFSFTPEKEIKAPEVKNIYPLADELPANFLKFYIEFDQSMASGHVYDYLQLSEDGVVIENAFIPLKPELWDAEMQLLTVWIDPGRIKKELGPNKRFGTVLKEGNTYQFKVRKGLKAANGANLSNNHSKTFKVIDRDEKIPSVGNWILTPPENSTKEPLVLNMLDAMDYAVQYFVSIQQKGKELAVKKVFLSDSRISFEPEVAWQKGDYVMRIVSKAEDLAGNNLNRPFDLDLNEQQELSDQEYHEIKFAVR